MKATAVATAVSLDALKMGTVGPRVPQSLLTVNSVTGQQPAPRLEHPTKVARKASEQHPADHRNHWPGYQRRAPS